MHVKNRSQRQCQVYLRMIYLKEIQEEGREMRYPNPSGRNSDECASAPGEEGKQLED